MELVVKTSLPIEGVQHGIVANLDESRAQEKDKSAEIYQRGFDDGLRIGKEESSKIRERLISVIQDVLEEKQSILSSAQVVILKLASMIAKKIIYKEIDTDSDIILKVVKEALSGISDKVIMLKVSPGDIDLVKGNREEWNTLLNQSSNFEIVADKKIEKGGCLIDTSSHEIDASIQSKLKKIDEILDLTTEPND
ncbi:hypothetical protein KAW50_01610 [candidate division WOR-3 bacterium]|nr:hypothetical protein [candidate division WOR-3 bacterium]